MRKKTNLVIFKAVAAKIMGLTIYLEGGYVTFFRRRIFFFRRHKNHIFLFSGEVPI
jgi:hypothetical protein